MKNRVNITRKQRIIGLLFASLFIACFIGFIYVSKYIKEELSIALYILIVAIIVLFFAIIRNKVKEICKNQINKISK